MVRDLPPRTPKHAAKPPIRRHPPPRRAPPLTQAMSRPPLVRLARSHAPKMLSLSPEGLEAEAPSWASAIRGARLVYFGERHGHPEVLAAQLRVLCELAESRQSVSVVMEMFHTGNQAAIDGFMGSDAADNEVEALAAALAGQGTNGFDVRHYGHVAALAKALKNVRVFAGFPPRSEEGSSVKVAAKRGFAEGLRRAVAEGSLSPSAPAALLCDPEEAHYNAFEALISGRDLRAKDPPSDRYRRIFPAQALTDAVCAAKVVQRIDAGDTVLVLAGNGHTDFGMSVPRRVERGLRQGLAGCGEGREGDGDAAFAPAEDGDGDVVEAPPAAGSLLPTVRITCRHVLEDTVARYETAEGEPSEPVADFVCRYGSAEDGEEDAPP